MSTRSSDIVKRNTNYKHPFQRYLHKKFLLPIDKSEVTPEAQKLQQLIDIGNNDGYRELRATLELKGRKFRLTDNKVTETVGVEEEIEVPVMVQVKGHSITWYFVLAPKYKDRYPQKFRDILYTSAAEAHQNVKRGCDLYYRGSNAFHVKTMHTDEREAHWNHNHYRMADNTPVTAVDFREHMEGFLGTLACQPSATQEGAFMDDYEVEDICRDFEQWYKEWTYKGLDRTQSYEDEYMALPQNKLNKVDVIEFYMFGEQQEPCRIDPAELKQDYEDAREKIEKQFSGTGNSPEALVQLEKALEEVHREYQAVIKFRGVAGSKGLLSKIANVRQLDGSYLSEIDHVTDTDDSIGLGETPQIPMWAIHARKNMLKTLQIIKKTADLDSNPELEKKIQRFGKVVGQEEKALETSVRLSETTTTLFQSSDLSRGAGSSSTSHKDVDDHDHDNDPSSGNSKGING